MFFCTLPILIGGAAEAMSVSPLVLEMEASGNRNHAEITLTNDGVKPFPAQVEISDVEISQDGEFAATKAAKAEFLVIPPQALVPPGTTQSFRIQWLGDPNISSSRSYLASIKQVPVKLAKDKSGMQVTVSFTCLVNVAPRQGNASIELQKVETVDDGKGGFKPRLTLKNSGNIHARLADATVQLSGDGWSQTFTPDDLRQNLGVGLLQPGKTRRFVLRTILPPHIRNLTGTINYKRPNK
jgi:fimbrial chaperone protein